jgi:hypothetical protein
MRLAGRRNTATLPVVLLADLQALLERHEH